MIHDQLARIDTYRPLSKNIERAIRFLHESDLTKLPAGRCEIDGERVFAIMHEYETISGGRSNWESHRRYIDLQLVLAGEEKIMVCDIARLQGTQSYNADKDATFYDVGERPLGVDIYAGQFAIFFPHDGHNATFAIAQPSRIRKLVMKIEVQ